MNVHKDNLRQLLTDSQVMKEMQQLFGSERGKKESASAIPVDSEATFHMLLSGNQEAVSADNLPLMEQEAIILLTGRPSLLIQNGQWEKPPLGVIKQRLEQSKDALLQAIPKVGRIEITAPAGFSPFIGTGWMIDEGIMITNRHVAKFFAEQKNSSFVFKNYAAGQPYQVQVGFLREQPVKIDEWQAKIKDILFIEEEGDIRPDMALVRLDAGSGGHSLPGPIALDEINPTASPTSKPDVAVIGYPASDPSRNDYFEMDRIFKGIYNVKRLSPGKIMSVEPNGKRLMHDCTTLGGSSGSAIINLVTGKVCGLHFGGTYLKENLSVSVGWLKSRLAEINRRVSVTMQLPLQPDAVLSTDTASPSFVPAEFPIISTQQPAGYDPAFLGGGTAVPLPEVPDADLIARVQGADDGVLRYTHFSIIMHKERRLPFFTACNINGQLLYKFSRSSDRWKMDERLEDYAQHQIGEELYKNNPLDRGHLVRRLDPAWGETREEAKRAEQETFFFTNCSPQHSQLNQKTWLSLEDYILDNAGTHDLKVCVFTGPVMTAADTVYRGVQIPKEFWKVVAVRNAFTGQLSAAAYLLSQSDYLNNLEFVFGPFRTYQVAVSTIEEKTGLSFGDLQRYDQMQFTEGLPFRVVEGETDIAI